MPDVVIPEWSTIRGPRKILHGRDNTSLRPTAWKMARAYSFTIRCIVVLIAALFVLESGCWGDNGSVSGSVPRPPAVSRDAFEIPLLPAVPLGPAIPLPPVLKESAKPAASSPPASANNNIVEGTGNFTGMILIPAGTFEMGSPVGEGRVDERPAHKVNLKAFYISKHQVTAAAYCRFLNEQGVMGKDGLPRVNLTLPECPVEKGLKRFQAKNGMDEKPMVCVSWNGATDYAKWAGGRLPTSAEWERAALITTPYPPGDSLTVLKRDSSVPVSIGLPGAGGMTGIIGNVWEWCSDWYAKDYYAQSPPANPGGPALGEEKVIRGGSWASMEASKRIKNVHSAHPLGCYRTVGFRIVKDVPSGSD